MKRLFFRMTALTLCLLTLLSSAHALTVEQAIDLLEEHYIDELPEEALQAQTMDELMAAVGDPYTVYMTPEEYASFTASIHDTRLVGIGVSIEAHEQGILIVSVVDDSPALEAGLVAGDVVLTADGTPLTSTELAQTLLAGEVGSAVTIEVLRTDGTIVPFTLTRREIVIPTTVQSFLTEDDNALVIACGSFGQETPRHFAKALLDNTDKVNAFIVDLSANPGGTSDSGAGAAGSFIGSGMMLYLRDGQDRYNYTMVLPGQEPKTDKPAIVLTSSYTASSSELFLGAIRDYNKGIAIGQRTTGKGIAQIAFDEKTYPDLFQGDALKITVYRFFSPKGATNDKIGVMPTFLMSLENAYHAALLLCGDAPESAADQLKLTVNDHIFFIDLKLAMTDEYRAAFTELLEAAPPFARLRWDRGDGKFEDTTAAAVAKRLGLEEYTPRTFSDLADSANADAINTLAAYKLLSGYGDGTFRPADVLTRAEFCAMLANVLALELPPVTESKFFDVGVSDWFAPAVHAMYDKGLLTGYGDGSFHPNNAISQQEIVSILSTLSTQLNMYPYNRRNLTPTDEVMAEFAHFSDWAQHAAWLLDSCNVDISSLTTPQDNATRGLAAELICRLLVQTNILWQQH